MNAKIMSILISAAFLVPAGVVAASGANGGSPTEADPMCERTRNGSPTNYPGIGWYPQAIPADSPVGPTRLMVCEGEHWDGQDSIRPNDASSGSCTANSLNVNNDAYILAFNQCDTPAENPSFAPTNPLGVRASAQGDKQDLNNGAAYLAIRIGNVGQVALFAGGCHKLPTGTGAPQMFGSYGTQGCQGSTGHGVAGVYLQDDEAVPLENTLARVVSAARLTKGYVAEGDCTQAEYERSAWAVSQGQEPTCGRDNTAITIELLA